MKDGNQCFAPRTHLRCRLKLAPKHVWVTILLTEYHIEACYGR